MASNYTDPANAVPRGPQQREDPGPVHLWGSRPGGDGRALRWGRDALLFWVRVLFSRKGLEKFSGPLDFSLPRAINAPKSIFQRIPNAFQPFRLLFLHLGLPSGVGGRVMETPGGLFPSPRGENRVANPSVLQEPGRTERTGGAFPGPDGRARGAAAPPVGRGAPHEVAVGGRESPAGGSGTRRSP